MFKFLKDKLKQAVQKITRRVQEEPQAEKLSEAPPPIPTPSPEPVRIPPEQTPKKKKDVQPALPAQQLEQVTKEPQRDEQPKKGFFGRLKEKIVTKRISAETFDELFFDLEVVLLENNVAYDVVAKIKEDLKKKLVDTPLPRGKVEATIEETLRASISDLLNFPPFDLLAHIHASAKKPFVIAFVGVNGCGKTTTVAKVAHLLQEKGLKCVLAAADTFRSGAVEQLQTWGKELHIPVIAQKYGSDAASVCFDAISHARSKNLDVVLIDTAGRQYSNVNLMEEMKKIVRVAKPDLKIFVGEALVGNDAVEQAQQFHAAVGLDGVILTKADVDEKGGAIISVSYVTGKPILYLGKGQGVNDLQPFLKEELLHLLGLS